MDKILGPNIADPEQFNKALQYVMDAVYKLLELTKEYDLKPIADNGYTRVYWEKDGKDGFQVCNQYERPTEFLQTLLDMIRVQYEPRAMGTFFLNSNIGFLYEEMPKEPFQLAYATLVSKEGEDFGSFLTNEVSPYLAKCGYDEENITALFAVASTGHERYKMQFVAEIARPLKSGFSVDDVLGLMASSIDSSVSKPKKQNYSGYCLVPELGTRIRLSLWCFINSSHLSGKPAGVLHPPSAC